MEDVWAGAQVEPTLAVRHWRTRARKRCLSMCECNRAPLYAHCKTGEKPGDNSGELARNLGSFWGRRMVRFTHYGGWHPCRGAETAYVDLLTGGALRDRRLIAANPLG